MILRVLVATAAFALITFVGVDLITPDRPVTTVETISLELDEQPNTNNQSKKQPSDKNISDRGNNTKAGQSAGGSGGSGGSSDTDDDASDAGDDDDEADDLDDD